MVDVNSWDGTLSSREFFVAASVLAERWRRLNRTYPPWTWIPCPNRHLGLPPSHQVNGYLAIEKFCVPWSTAKHMPYQGNLSERTQTGTEVGSCSSEENELFDDATLVESNSSEVHYYDFHIVYSASYRVPVLYFRGYCIDGQPLMLDEIEKDLPASSTKVLLESKWTFITQEEHPHLDRPWYKLHPCGTSEWMKLLFESDVSLTQLGVAIKQYLVSWLSVVGQVVGLTIPAELLNSPNQS